MANDNHIKAYTAVDIEKYHKGQLSPAEMHAMEKAALDDPFLADAMDGYTTSGVNVQADIAELRRRIQQRTEQAKVIPINSGGARKLPFLRIAVMIVVLVLAGYLITRVAFNKSDNTIADTGKPPITTVRTDTGTTTVRTPEVKAPASVTDPKTTDKSIATRKTREKTASGVVENFDKEISSVTPSRAPVISDSARNADVSAFKKDGTEAAAADKAVASGRDSDKKAKVSPSGTFDDAAARRSESQRRAQSMNTFRGRVTDDSNNGIPFANVTTIPDNAGTYADANGYFNFRSPDTVLDVQVRSIGFENNVSRLRNAAPTNQIVLEEDRSMNEVVLSNNRPNTEARARRSNVTLEEPEPADGWTNYDAYLANNLNVPDEYRSKPNPNPTVEVSFEVDQNGEPVNIRIERSLCKKCDNEAIRLIKEGPKWKSNASNRGRTTVTINF
jgi:hypothetical protein